MSASNVMSFDIAISIFKAGYVMGINYLQIQRKDPNPTYNWL